MGRPSGPDEMYCPQCGERIDRESRFCTYCGAAIDPGRRREPSSSGDAPGPLESGRDDAAVPPHARRRRKRKRGTRGQSADDHARSDPSPRGDHDQPDPQAGHQHPDRRPPAQHQPRGGQVPQGGPQPAGGPERAGDRGYNQTRIGAESLSIPTTDESLFRTVGVAVGLGLAGILVLGTISILVGGAAAAAGLPNAVTIAVATGLGQYVGFVGLAVLYLRNRGYKWPDVRSYVGLRPPSLKDLAVYIGGLVLMYALLFLVVAVVAQFLPEPAENQGAQQLTSASSTAAYVGAVAFMFLVVGPCEEFLFRGLVQNRLREHLTAAPAILIASATFASVHVIALVGSPLSAILTTVTILFVPALVLGGVYEYTGNLVVPSLLHSTHNSLIVTLLFFGPESAQLLSWLAMLVP